MDTTIRRNDFKKNYDNHSREYSMRDSTKLIGIMAHVFKTSSIIAERLLLCTGTLSQMRKLDRAVAE